MIDRQLVEAFNSNKSNVEIIEIEFHANVEQPTNVNSDKSGHIIIKAEIDKQLRIPQGSSAEIVSDMLGNVKVNLLLANNPRERVAIGGIINGNINNGAMGQLQDMVPTVMAILPKLDSIAASLNVPLPAGRRGRRLSAAAPAVQLPETWQRADADILQHPRR